MRNVCCFLFSYVWVYLHERGEGAVYLRAVSRGWGGCTPPFLRWLSEFHFAPCSRDVSLGASFLCCRVIVVHGCIGHRLGGGSKSCGACGVWGVRFHVVHGVFSAAPSGCIRALGTCRLWAFRSPSVVTRFEGGGVAQNTAYIR